VHVLGINLVFDVTLGEALTILAQILVAAGVVFTLKGDIKQLSALFHQHDTYDQKQFDEIRKDIRSLRNQSYDEG